MGWDNMFRPSEGDNNPEQKRRIPADAPSTKFNALDFFKATQAGEIAQPITDRDKPEPPPDTPPVRQDLPEATKPDRDALDAPEGAPDARPDHDPDTSDDADTDKDPVTDKATGADEKFDADRSDVEPTEIAPEARHLPGPLDASKPEPSRPDQRDALTNDSTARVDRADTRIQLEVSADATEEHGSPYGSQRPETTQTVEIAAQDFNKPRTPFASRTDLEPNTLYQVEGRGDFYTDPGGTVKYVETTYGGRTELNPDLMNPRPDTTYVVQPDITNRVDDADHAHVFRTDHLGRTIYVHTDALTIGTADRSESVQLRVGKEGGEDYDGGHLFGNSFGGGGEYANLVPMLREVNRGSGDSFYSLENQWRGMLRETQPPKITVDIRIHYPDGGSTVPSGFVVEYSVNGELPKQRRFKND